MCTVDEPSKSKESDQGAANFVHVETWELLLQKMRVETSSLFTSYCTCEKHTVDKAGGGKEFESIHKFIWF